MNKEDEDGEREEGEMNNIDKWILQQRAEQIMFDECILTSEETESVKRFMELLSDERWKK